MCPSCLWISIQEALSIQGYVVSLSSRSSPQRGTGKLLREDKVSVVNIAKEKPAFCQLVTLSIMVIYRHTMLFSAFATGFFSYSCFGKVLLLGLSLCTLIISLDEYF